MSAPGVFDPRTPADILQLIQSEPLAWFVAEEGGRMFATPAPILPETSDGVVTAFVGHVPRSCALARLMADGVRALVLVLGPHGYVSPSWLTDRTRSPTWNYTAAQLTCDLTLVDDADFCARHLEELCAATEHGRDNAWSPREMGPRFAMLAKQVVTFRGDIVDTSARFKLGQDERDDIYTDIVDGLSAEGSDDLLAWMAMFNPR